LRPVRSPSERLNDRFSNRIRVPNDLPRAAALNSTAISSSMADRHVGRPLAAKADLATLRRAIARGDEIVDQRHRWDITPNAMDFDSAIFSGMEFPSIIWITNRSRLYCTARLNPKKIAFEPTPGTGLASGNSCRAWVAYASNWLPPPECIVR